MDNHHNRPVNRQRSASYPNRPLVVPSRVKPRQPLIDVVKLPPAQPKRQPDPLVVAPVINPVAIPTATQVKPAMPTSPLAKTAEPRQSVNHQPKLKPTSSRKEKRLRRHGHQLKLNRLFLDLIIGILLLAAAYMVYDTWRTNNEVKQSLTSSAQSKTTTQDVTVAVGDGKDVTPLPTNTLANYKVAADLPRAIYINKLKVAARLLPMGINKDNSLQAPNNIYDAGWYNGSSKPGQVGAMLIDGHASQTGTHYGLFGRLETLVDGDTITIEKGDGTKLNFAVAKVEIVPLNQVDMTQVLVPYDSHQQGLNLITCAGDWTKDGKTLDHRVIVYALPA